MVDVSSQSLPTEESLSVIDHAGQKTALCRLTARTGDVAFLVDMLNAARECAGYVDPAVIQYAVRLTAATRHPARDGLAELGRYVSFGASPRATIHLVEGARALAYLRGRAYVLPEDVTDLAPDVLRHRLVLSYEALADGVTPDDLVQRILRHVPAPEKPLAGHVRVGARD